MIEPTGVAPVQRRMLIPKFASDLLLAAALALAALLLQWPAALWIGPRFPLMVIEVIIVLTAATLGRMPATLVMLIGGVNAALALTPPGHWLVSDPADLMAIAVYAVIGALLITCGSRLHFRDRRAERAERAEQRLSLAQDETGVGLFELDYRAGTAYASPALCQILGQPVMQGGVPLEQWLQALDAGHVSDSRRTLEAKVAAGELRYERELRVQLPDGQTHWLLSRIRLDLDEKGQLAAARGATLDITARKQLVTELEFTQAQLQQQLDDLGMLQALGNRLLAMPLLDAALQAILDAVCSFHGGALGLLRLHGPSGNARVAAHCGLAGEALRQLASSDPPDAAGPSCNRRVVVEDIEGDDSLATLRPLARALGLKALYATPLLAGAGGPVLGTITVFSTAVGRPDTRLERLTDLCAGQAAALVEREQALSLARETQQRFEVALQSSPVAFAILAPVRDTGGRIVDFSWAYANPAAAALIDRPVHELLGRPILEILPHAWNEDGFFDRYVQVSERGTSAEFDTLTSRPGGQRWLHVIASPLNGSVVLWFADITQRREEQQALQDADRRKDEFLATLAHELRNPLAPIRHAASILSQPAANDRQWQWSLTVIERQVRHMALLLDDLLDVSRITRGTLPLRRERCLLRAIVDGAVETAQPLFTQRRHRLELELPDEDVFLDVDPLRLGQVLGNLLVNAAKYTPPGGQVMLGARQEAGMLVVTVADNGNGLRPEDCERVFDMFVQIPLDHGGQQQGGLGIGLALARQLVAMHGGGLEVRSAGLGQGCTFTVRLPAPEAEGLPAAAVDPAPLPVAMPGKRILIADDNRDAADGLAMLLEMDGHTVQVAYDGREALDRHASFKPQIALLDMGMPQLTGSEVAALIRRQPGGESMTLIAITGFGQESDRLQAKKSGFDHHMTKPFEFERLQSLINEL